MSEIKCLLEQFARDQPDKVAFSFLMDGGRRDVSFRALWQDVISIGLLKDRPNSRLLHFIRCDTSYANVVGYIATLFTGNYPAFLSPLTARMDPAIYQSELQALINRFRPHLLTGFESLPSLTTVEPRPVGEGFGFVQFSSGTTSLRKGVFISERQLLDQVAALAERLQLSPGDRIASWLPLYHDMGLITSLFLPIVTGCSASLLDPVEWSYRPSLLLDLIQQDRSTLCWLPDFAFNHITNWRKRSNDTSHFRLQSLRWLINCSEPCRASTFRSFLETFEPMGLREAALQTSYAMAETVFAVTQSSFSGRAEWGSGEDSILSSGFPLSSCEFQIVSEGGAAVGAIQVKSPFLFDGYLNQENTGRFERGWYNTGDLGFLKGGQIYVLGRKDDTIIVNGKKIMAHEVEAFAGGLPGIKPGRLICVANEERSALNLYYEGSNLDPSHQKLLRKWVTTSCGVSLDRLVLLEDGFIVKSSAGKLAREKTCQKLSRNSLISESQQDL